MTKERRTSGSPLTEVVSVRPARDDPHMKDRIELAATLTGETPSDFMRRVVVERTQQIIDEVGPEKMIAELNARQDRERAERLARARATLASFGASEPQVGGTSSQSIGAQESARVTGTTTRQQRGKSK